MTDWEIKEHPDFFKDLDKLGTKELEIFYNKKNKIKQNKKNPSRADEKKSDSTVGKVVNWAEKRDFTSVIFLNLFCYITPDSSFFNDANINSCIGKEANQHIKDFTLKYNSATIVAAWGNKPKRLSEQKYRERIEQVVALVGKDRLKIVGALTKRGYPRHGLSWNGNPQLDDYSKFFK